MTTSKMITADVMSRAVTSLKDILVDPDYPSGSRERAPLVTYETKYCEWHEAYTWRCYCAKEIDVEVRVYLK